MSARIVSVCAPAKINLFLHIGDKRADGYHALESLAVFAQTGDRLSLSASKDISLAIEGPFAEGLSADSGNLVLKAAHSLARGRNLGAVIMLEKNLPLASGIGGGSADAAAALRALNLLWDLGLSETDLCAVAEDIGSDVPACVLSRPVWMDGRGEILTPVSVPPLNMLLINPGVAVPTGQVFDALQSRSGLGAVARLPDEPQTLWDISAYLEDARNDLERPAIAIAPVINDVLTALETANGCVLARMSGSGATCFGLFEGRNFALRAAAAIEREHPDWWLSVTQIAEPDIGAPEWR